MHTVGFCVWLVQEHPELRTTLIHPIGDGQDAAYADTRLIHNLLYSCPNIGVPAILYVMRASMGTIRVRVPWVSGKNVIVASSHFLPDVLPVFLKGKRSKGVVRAVYIHHIIQDMPRAKSLSNSLADLQEKLCFALIKRRFDKVIVVNHAVAKRLQELGFRRQQVLESSNFVTITPPTVAQPYSTRDTTIIFCGRLVQQKGVDDFLKVCEFLQQYIADFRAVMIGVGPEMERLRGIIARKKLAVEMTGFLSETEKFKHLERAKLFVFPSIEEGWGIAIAEALAVGTPVLAYDLAVYREVFGTVLRHVPISKLDELTQACLKVLQRYQQEPATFIRDQQRAIASAQRFIRDTVAVNEYTFLME